ncbi:hypothetical protein D3C83_112990 [compost metagenome]
MPKSSDAKKSVVSRPMPLSLDAFGSFVAKRNPIAGCATPSGTRRIFVPMTKSSTLDVESPVAVTIDDSGASWRDEMESRL